MNNGNFVKSVLVTDALDPTLLTDLLARDASVWLGGRQTESVDVRIKLAQMVTLPWRAVAIESSEESLVIAIEALKDQASLVPRRGYVDLIAANPENITLAARTLPVYLLNGRDGASDSAESSALPPRKSTFRRYAMLSRLQEQTARHIVIVVNNTEDIVPEFIELWKEGFRSRVTVVTDNEHLHSEIRELVSSIATPPTITVLALTATAFATQISKAVFDAISPDLINLKIRAVDKSVGVIDASTCDLPDQPILDRYELIRASDLSPLLPTDLKATEIDAFFRRDNPDRNWRVHAAALPWFRNDLCKRQLLNRLRKMHGTGAELNTIATIVAESGSGCTTLMEHLAYAAAGEGYPTLVAKRASFVPNATELVGFLNRLLRLHLESIATRSDDSRHQETPTLVAFDAQHWRGNEELIVHFVKKLERSGRSVIALVVMDSDGEGRMPKGACMPLDIPLSHQFSEEEAVELGVHLNKFLEHQGSSRNQSEWRAFYSSYQPAVGDFGATPVSFWIALEFWLRRQVPLGETIQGWLFKQFQSASLQPDLAKLVLQIAAMTIERVGTPEELLSLSAQNNLPQSILLEQTRYKIPALGLFRTRTALANQWMLGHPLIARFLLSAVAQDRSTIDATIRLQSNIASFVQLRLALLALVANSPQLAESRYRDLAEYFATTILKLDRDGNREFFHEWRKVLEILENVPQRVWESSRAFNHHVAISRRRIASDEELFPLSPQEKFEQLTAAAEHLSFALDHIEENDNDDSSLNLLNSLARCYLDLVALSEGALSNKPQASHYRQLAAECTQRAFELNPLNSFVLETRARELILSAIEGLSNNAALSAANACEAIDCVLRALNLESAPSRESKLHELLVQAFQLLQSPSLSKNLVLLRAKRDPIGLVGCAWLELRSHLSTGEPLLLTEVSNQQIDSALALLEQIPLDRRKPLDLRLRYELVVRKQPFDFQSQLEILEQIGGSSSQLDHQMRLELAILLYQVGRSPEGSAVFEGLRPDLRNSDSFVNPPPRLRILRKPGSSDALTCQASFARVDNYGKTWAKVQELMRAEAPFNSLEFGKSRMQAKEHFQCIVTFGPNGPFLRPREASK